MNLNKKQIQSKIKVCPNDNNGSGLCMKVDTNISCHLGHTNFCVKFNRYVELIAIFNNTTIKI